MNVPLFSRLSTLCSSTCDPLGSSPSATPPPDMQGQRKSREKTVKKRLATFVTMLSLCAPLAFPIGLAAQEQEEKKEQKANHHHYKVIDLGTLGGPQSVVSGFLTHLLNNRGTVAGCADTPTADPNFPDSNFQGFSPRTPDPFVFHAFRWQDGLMTDLGALPGINNACPIWMSENGMIAGGSENGLVDPITGMPESRAILWKDGGVIDLGTLGGTESVALAMNNRGQVVGAAANTIPDPFSSFGFPDQTRAFLWQSGVMEDLGTLGGPDAFAASINRAGQIAGCSYSNSTPNSITGLPTEAPFLWKDGKMINLGTLGGTLGCASIINNHGQVMGASNLEGDIVSHGFFWERGELTDLGSLGGNVSPEWLDDDGEVVGGASLPDTIQHAFFWKDGRMTDIGTLSGDVTSNAIVVNEGRVVGVSFDASGNIHSFLWENGGPMVDLSTLIPPNSVLQPVVPFAINERAEIAGTGLLPNGDFHAFLLIPCDEGESDAEGCGSKPVEATTEAPVQPPQIAQVPAARRTQLSPAEMKDQIRALLTKRNRR
jgi:probable HAF family extracellular repeat protein